ncbi:phage tail protein [Burkholderia cepacia]|uniref:YmfQ family protein n=1 Tax=Burkholderia cepacia TaxID=292 RepID=UPI00075EEAD0|nr:putative phage tail protein [Burkholderia cepacia]KWF84973.1 phage tail protein [Burkholderia cepacia]
MTSHADLLGRLLPPVAYDPNASNLAAELAAEGKALDRALNDADTIAAAVTPYRAFGMLPDYERLLAIVPPEGATVQQRIATIVSKMNETGGLSIPYFLQLAAGLGYSVQINEPQPFRVDSGRVGDGIYVEDVIYQWEVVANGAPELVYVFRVGQSAVGERLMSFSDPLLEQVIRDLKPAHTYVYFSYTGSENAAD